MNTIAASEFKAKCLEILDHVPPEGLAITKRGRPVARLFPMGVDNSDLIGSMPEIKVHGNIFSTGLKWDAES